MKRITLLMGLMLAGFFAFGQNGQISPEEIEKLKMEREALRIEYEQQLKEVYRDIHFPSPKAEAPDYQKGLAFPGEIQVLILSPDNDGSEAIRAALDGYGHINATSFPQANLPTLSLSDLTPYDVILTFNNNQWLSVGGVSADLVGDLLADYIDQGGLFVENSYVMDWDAWQMGGAYVNEGYSAFTQATMDFSGTFSMGTIHEPGHPILTDVSSFASSGSTLIQDNGLASGATAIADWNNGQLLLAVKDQVASFNFLTMATGQLNYTGDGTTLYNNAIVWLMLNQADPDAPGEPAGFTATAGAMGALDVELSWNNPDVSVAGDPLTDLDAVHVSRNGVVIHTITNPVIGGAETYTDDDIAEAGNYSYSVFGENALGEGLSASASVYVGEDVPAAPGNLVLAADGSDGHISWDTPTEGLNGGYLSGDNITYSLTRMPDEVEVADGISETTFLDTTVPGIGNYFYTVTASNDIGVGGTAESNIALLGAEGVLMYETFDYPTGTIPPGWELTGVAHAWSVFNSSNAGGEAPELRLTWTPAATGMSRLVSYPVNVEGHEELRFKFRQYLNNYSTNEGEIAAIDVSFDGGDNWEAIWEIVIEDDVPAGEYELYFDVPAGETEVHFGFRFDGDSYNINQWYLDDMILEPVLDNDLVGVSVTGNTTPSEGVESIYTITVLNAGTNMQDNYTVKLMQEGGIEIASVAGEPIEFAESITYQLPWTPDPDDVGPTYLYGYVDFAGDELPGNNQTPNLNVTVQPGDIVAITIGDGANMQGLPYNFFWHYSISQTLYFPEEIGLGGGVITGIQYYNDFNDAYLDRDVMIWLGETDADDLTGGWVDPASLQLVFDGTVDFPAGQNEIYINFDDIYVYGGGNLVVYSYKADDVWSSGKNFFNTDAPNSNRSRRAQRDGTPFDPAAPDADGALLQYFPNITMFFSTAGLGALEGTVTENGDALEGVHVHVMGTNSTAMTDEDGFFEFPFLLPGTYDIHFSKFGYYDSLLEDVVVEEDETTVVSASMDAMPTVTVSGFVGGSDFPDEGLEGAMVTLTGYDDYETLTDAAGQFEIGGVYADNDYDIHVSFEGYEPYSDLVEVGTADLVLDDIILTEIAFPVSNVVAQEVAAGALITWDEPAPTTEFRYDDGEVDAWLGFQGTWNSVMGAVHFRNATLHEMTWMLTEEGGPHATVKVWVLGLTPEGTPDRNNIMYTAENVPNVDNQWNTYTFSDPVAAPDGFFIGVSYDGFLGLAVDDGVGEPWNFVPGTQFGVFNITDPTSAFTDISFWGFQVNYLLRGYGMDFGPAKRGAQHFVDTDPIGPAPILIGLDGTVNAGEPVYGFKPEVDVLLGGKALESFNIHRFNVADQDDMDAWDTVATGVTDWEYTDTDWYDLDGGVYKYAVVAVYTNDLLAVPALSNELALGMNVEFTVNVSTNSGDSPEGAELWLVNQSGNEDHAYHMMAPADGVVVFPSVWMGAYDLYIELDGFHAYVVEGVDIYDEGLSHDAELIQYIVETFVTFNVDMSPALDLGFDPDEHSVYLTGSFTDWAEPGTGNSIEMVWSGKSRFQTILYENFNGGSIPDGWLNLDEDGDGNVWTIVTTPGHGPYDGDYAVMSASWQGGTILYPDNWLITPRLEGVTDDWELSWAVKTQDPDWPSETYDVLISTTNPDPTQFTSIFSETLIDDIWIVHTLSLADFAGESIYVAFRHHDSIDWFQILLDAIHVTGTPGESHDPEGMFFSASLPIEEGHQQYKYFSNAFGEGWDGGEWAGDPLREIEVSGSTTVYDTWGVIDDDPDPDTYPVTFNVNDQNGQPISNAMITVTPGDSKSASQQLRMSRDKMPVDNRSGNGLLLELQASDDAQAISMVSYSDKEEGEWIQWDNGENFGSAGLNAGGLFYVASRWEPSDIAAYDGMEITKMNIFINNVPTSVTAKIWQGANAGSLVEVMSQSVSASEQSWIEFDLADPYVIDASQELWFGYEVDDPGEGNFAAGRDNSATVDGKGNMVKLGADGEWQALSDFGIDGNWNIAAWTGPGGGPGSIIIYTDDAGQASFDAISGHYTYIVEKEGYLEASGHFNLEDAPKQVDVTMHSDSGAPLVTFNVDMAPALDLGFDPDEHSVYLTGSFTDWAEPGTNPAFEMQQVAKGNRNTFYENWDSFDDWTTNLDPWTTVDVHGGDTWSASDFDFDLQTQPFAFGIFNPETTDPSLVGTHDAYDGTKFAFAVGQTAAPAEENKWLISPAMEVTADSELSFAAKSITVQYGMERFRVYVSTDGTDLDDFVQISTGDYLEVGDDWEIFSFGLGGFAGETIHFAVECVSYDAFMFFLDAFEVTNLAGDDPPPSDEMVYTITIEVEEGHHQYKYFSNAFGEGWDGGEWEDDFFRDLFIEDNMLVEDIWGTLDSKFTLTLTAYPEQAGVLGGEGEYSPGAIVQVSAVADAAYAFLNWTDEQGDVISEEPAFLFTMPYESVSLTAHFEALPTYDLFLIADPEGSGMLEGAGGYLEGSQVTVMAIPGDGFRFQSWSDAEMEVSPYPLYSFVMPATDLTLTAAFTPTDTGTVVDVEGNVYPTIVIGDQEWMASNLKSIRYQNGDLMPQGPPQPNAIPDNACYFYYDNLFANVSTFGLLYTGYVVKDDREICPPGWQIPSNAQWMVMELELGMSWKQANNSNTWSGASEGGKLKAEGFELWRMPNVGGSDEYGFAALPGGYRISSFWSKNERAYFWTSSLSINNTQKIRMYDYNTAKTNQSSMSDFSALSIRCVKIQPGQSLPEVFTGEVLSYGSSSAVLSAYVSDDGNTPVRARGLVYGTVPNPVLDVQQNYRFTSNGEGLGNFEADISDLLPGTTYFARAYAVNAAGISYGEEAVFHTSAGSLPNVNVFFVEDITEDSFTISAEVTSDGGSPVLERGFVWSEGVNPSLGDNYVAVGSGLGDFWAEINGLSPNTLYYVKAYATNESGTNYSFQRTALTLSDSPPPTLATPVASDVTGNTANISAAILDDGGSEILDHGFVFQGQDISLGSDPDDFFLFLDDLAPATEYIIRAYAINQYGRILSPVLRFNTLTTSTDEAMTLLQGIYDYMFAFLTVPYGNHDNFGVRSFDLTNDLMGEDMVVHSAGYGWFNAHYRYQAHANKYNSLVQYTWARYYDMIDQVNFLLDHIDDVEGFQPVKDNIKGQLLALRAFCHFELVQVFANPYGYDPEAPGIPYVTDTQRNALNFDDMKFSRHDLLPDSPEKAGDRLPDFPGQERSIYSWLGTGVLHRGTVSDVYLNLHSDLELAISLLTNTGVQAHPSHVDIAVAHGMRARVALASEDFHSASIHAQAAIDAFGSDNLFTQYDYPNPLELIYSGGQVAGYDFTAMSGFNNAGESSEWMWGSVISSENATIYASFFSHMDPRFMTYASLGGQKKITLDLFDQIPDTDVRRNLFMPEDLSFVGSYNGYGANIPPLTQLKFLVQELGSWAADYLYMRLGEMYLIRAEALARSGQYAEAASTLFELVSQRDPAYDLSVNTGDVLLQEILLHRRIELWGEGHRFKDIRRLELDLYRPSGQGNHDQGMAGILELPANDDLFLWAIPFHNSLSISIIGEGSILVDEVPYTEPVYVAMQSMILLEAQPANTWHFAHWLVNGQMVDSESHSFLFDMPNENVHLAAVFLEGEDPLHQVIFSVYDHLGQTLDDAVIEIDGIVHQPGLYVFDQMEAGSYNYSVAATCYAIYHGQFIIEDTDLSVTVHLDRIPGDANGDGLVNVLDAIVIIGYMLDAKTGQFCFYNADVNEDGQIDILDAVATLNIMSDNKATPYPSLVSAPAELIMGEDGICIKSDGSLTGVQLELFAEPWEVSGPILQLPYHQLAVAYQEGVVKFLVYSLDNRPIPKGRTPLLHFEKQIGKLSIKEAFAGNINADRVEIELTGSQITGLSKLPEEISISVYPNPADKKVFIDFDNHTGSAADVSLISVYGQIVQSKVVHQQGDIRVSFNIGSLSEGIYILKVQIDDASHFERLIIQ